MTEDDSIRAEQHNVPERGATVFAVQGGTQNVFNLPRPVPPPIPHELPLDVSKFTGRSAELEELDHLLTGVGVESTAVVISAVSGTAGVGKTALAVRWAHKVANEFPDGQLYVDLRGYHPDDQPMAASDALAAFLRALGVEGPNVPFALAERAARYRTLVADKRMLIVLDNASSFDQVSPLLPGAPSCLVLVTSRDRLVALAARHDVYRISLDVLPLADAVALLRSLIGPRVDEEAAECVKLARQCALLPLALRLAAEVATARPASSLAELVLELSDEERRWELMDAGGDPHTDVRSVFSWSYRQLDENTALAFRLLGLQPGADFDVYATAALIGADRRQAQRELDLLVGAHLIQLTSPRRYEMHDLLRAYSASLSTGDNREAARSRLFSYYLVTTANAMDALYPVAKHRRPSSTAWISPSPDLSDPASATSWLEAELQNLALTAVFASAHGRSSYTIQLAQTLFRFLDVNGHYADALTINARAALAAEQDGDRVGEGHALTNRGLIFWRQGRNDAAVSDLTRAITLLRSARDRGGEARALDTLGLVHWRQGHYAEASAHFQRALVLFGEVGERFGEAEALDDIGLVYERQGHLEEARDYFTRAAALYGDLGDRAAQGYALMNLGVVQAREGRYEDAARHHAEALIRFRETGYRVGEALALMNIGAVERREGRYRVSADHYQQSLALLRDLGDRAGEAEALNGYGQTLHALGQYGLATTQHVTALALATESGDRYEQARAYRGLADSNPATAHRHLTRALALYTSLNVTDAREIRERLAVIGANSNIWEDHAIDGYNVRVVREPYSDPDAKRLMDALDSELADLYGSGDRETVQKNDFAEPNGAFLVCYAGHRPVACAAMRLRHDIRPGQLDAEFKRMYVDPSLRRTGLGKTLLRELEERAREMGATRAVLETGTKSAEAIDLYLSFGYSFIPPFSSVYAESTTNRAMAKPLEG